VNLGRLILILALRARDLVLVAKRLDEKTLEAVCIESDYSNVFPKQVATTSLSVYWLVLKTLYILSFSYKRLEVGISAYSSLEVFMLLRVSKGFYIPFDVNASYNLSIKLIDRDLIKKELVLTIGRKVA